MKVLVVLALAIFTGSHASLFYADEPKSQLDVWTDAVWDYASGAARAAEDTLEVINKTPFGQQVSDHLRNVFFWTDKYVTTLQRKLPPIPPMAQDLMTKISRRAHMLIESLTQELRAASDKLEPYIDELRSQVQQRVDTEALKTTLMQKSEQLKSSLDQSVMELLQPYTEDLRQKVDQHLKDFQDSVVPMAEKVQAELDNRATQAKELVAPYAKDLQEKLDPYVQDLQAQLTTLYQSFTNGN
ncbi:uncharacterized protein LOC139918963 [Centroberyx gerrardi]